MKNSDIHIF